MNETKIMILGSEWTVDERSVKDDSLLEECDGYCDWTIRTIVVRHDAEGTLADMDYYIRKVKRHEIVHAFLFESGLAHASAPVDSWATNEEMVDWYARMGDKIHSAWRELGVI